MLLHNVTAIVARNEDWTGACATEPHECGWAREAVVFLRALKVSGMPTRTKARVQISPDGMRWLDSGDTLDLPTEIDGQAFVRVAHFGSWLRVAADVPAGAGITVLVTFQLKA
jgi:hypothetical protein